jgi:hypothetical protein
MALGKSFVRMGLNSSEEKSGAARHMVSVSFLDINIFDCNEVLSHSKAAKMMLFEVFA